MATCNSTENHASSCSAVFLSGLLDMPELEKTSCSLRGGISFHPIELISKRIRFAEPVLSEIDIDEGDVFESHISSGSVLAVQLGSIQHGIQTRLMLQHDDGSDPYYANIDTITVLDVLQ